MKTRNKTKKTKQKISRSIAKTKSKNFIIKKWKNPRIRFFKTPKKKYQQKKRKEKKQDNFF